MSEGLVGGEALAVDASMVVADAHRHRERRLRSAQCSISL